MKVPKSVAKLVVLLKRAANYIDEMPNRDLAAWAEIHDDLLAEIQLYDPKWTPGDDPEME